MNVPEPPIERGRAFPNRWIVVLIVAALAGAGGAGYFFGRAGIQQATLRVNVENRSTSDLSVQILVNGKLRETLTIPAGQTISMDEAITFAGPDGAFFEVQAVATGLLDADSVFVSSPGTYVINLRLITPVGGSKPVVTFTAATLDSGGNVTLSVAGVSRSFAPSNFKVNLQVGTSFGTAQLMPTTDGTFVSIVVSGTTYRVYWTDVGGWSSGTMAAPAALRLNPIDSVVLAVRFSRDRPIGDSRRGSSG